MLNKTLFHVKTTQQSRNRRKLPQHDVYLYEESIYGYIILGIRNFSSKIQNKDSMLGFITSVQDGVGNSIQQEIGKEEVNCLCSQMVQSYVSKILKVPPKPQN